MRYIISVAVFLLSFSLIGQEPSLVPIAPENKEENEKKEEEKEEKKGDYQDVYQQYLQKYNQPAEQQEKPAAEKAEAKEEPTVPVVTEEKKDEPAVVKKEEKKEKPKKEKKQKVKKEVVPLKPFETNPYFTVDAFGAFSNGVYLFGEKTLSSSWKFSLDNAILDFKGGDRMFNGRLLFDFAKGLRTDKVVAINYSYDSTMPTDAGNPVEYNVTPKEPNAIDILQDVSFSMTHPTYRSDGFGMNINLQVGKFFMPFGLETKYAHELSFADKSYLNSNFLGEGFNDVGLALGLDFLLSNEMNFALTAFVFNGKNKMMLDGDDYFQDPAFGIDLRLGLKGDFYATAALSFIFGSAYHDYSNARYGILETTNNTYLNDQSKTSENLILKEDGRNDYALNKKNKVFSIAADLGYKLSEDMSVGLDTQFVISNRDIFNPKRIDENGDTQFQGDDLRFIRDGSNNFWGSNSYTTFGFYTGPYAHLYMFDILARFSYNKAPFLYDFLEDSNNSTIAMDVNLIYNFSEYANVGISYRFVRETVWKYDKEYNDNPANNKEPWDYIKNIFNHNQIMLNLEVYYGYLWEKPKAE